MSINQTRKKLFKSSNQLVSEVDWEESLKNTQKSWMARATSEVVAQWPWNVEIKFYWKIHFLSSKFQAFNQKSNFFCDLIRNSLHKRWWVLKWFLIHCRTLKRATKGWKWVHKYNLKYYNFYTLKVVSTILRGTNSILKLDICSSKKTISRNHNHLQPWAIWHLSNKSK